MDGFVSTHTSNDYEGRARHQHHGLLQEADIPFYYDLAQKFTVCDNYFCSVLGPTHPNRLMQMTGTSTPPAWPAGRSSSPTTSEPRSAPVRGRPCPRCSRTPVSPGRSTTPRALYRPGIAGLHQQERAHVLRAVPADPPQPLYQNAFGYYGPNVAADLTDHGPERLRPGRANNTLPQVSWIISPDGYDEHPPAPPRWASGTPSRCSTP